MLAIATKILPVLLIFGVGVLLRKLHIFSKDQGNVFIKVLYYVALPALVLKSLTSIELEPGFFFLPLACAIVMLTTHGISRIFVSRFNLSREKTGAFLIGSTILNIGFLYPFIIALYGDEGMVRASMCDFANTFVTFTFAHFIASRYGSNTTKSPIAKKVLRSPPIWALITGIVLNITNITVPGFLKEFLEQTGNMTIPLFMLSLGLFFSPRFKNFKYILTVIMIRMAGGLITGLLVAELFNISGLTRTILLIISSAPVAFNTITLSSLEDLDKNFAATLVSMGLLAGIIFIPVILLWLG